MGPVFSNSSFLILIKRVISWLELLRLFWRTPRRRLRSVYGRQTDKERKRVEKKFRTYRRVYFLYSILLLVGPHAARLFFHTCIEEIIQWYMYVFCLLMLQFVGTASSSLSISLRQITGPNIEEWFGVEYEILTYIKYYWRGFYSLWWLRMYLHLWQVLLRVRSRY